MKRCALLIVVGVLFATGGFAQTKPPAEGVWKVIEVIEGGKTITDPQPALLIFTKGYYSAVMVLAPRGPLTPTKDPRNLTDAEKIERFEMWRPFLAMSGTYEVKGSTVVMRQIVAKDRWAMNRTAEFTFKFEGPNTIWVSPAGGGLQMKLTRLE